MPWGPGLWANLTDEGGDCQLIQVLGPVNLDDYLQV